MKQITVVLFAMFFSGTLFSQSCESPVVPDVFTPNNDGVNDLLIIKCIEFFPDNHFTVYNRWGQQVYDAEGYSNNWGGTWDQTKGDLPDGVYVYILSAMINNEKKDFTGTITITR